MVPYLIKNLLNILAYKRQKNTEGGWELLEEENENTDKNGLESGLSSEDIQKIKTTTTNQKKK
ncbi:UNVERIFIED_CONTAM: hypothetical protein Cloal_2890 [Acetivibrio alkalicellulosi]